MNNIKNNFQREQSRMWKLVIIAYTFLIYRIATLFFQFELNDLLNGFGIGISIGAIILLIQDMIKHKVYNRNFWILSIIFLPVIAALVYMLKREKLIKAGSNFSNHS